MPSLTSIVKQVTADLLETRMDSSDGSGPMTWKAVRVTTANESTKNAMYKTLQRNGAGPGMMEDFVGWADADEEHHGKPLVFYSEDAENESISYERAFPKGTPLELKGISDDQMQAWWRTQQNCDLACNTVMAVLQSYLLAKEDLTVASEEGDFKLVDVERYLCAAKMAFNAISWTANSPTERPDGIRAFADPKKLSAPKTQNHTILKLILRKPDGGKTHIWCDPTARQVFADMEIKEDGLHDVKFMKESTFRSTGKYSALRGVEPNEYLDLDNDPFDEDSWQSVKWSVAHGLFVFHQTLKKGYMSKKDVDRCIAKWKQVMDKHSRAPIDWESQHNAVAMHEAVSSGSGMLVRDMETGEMKPF